MKSFLDNIGQGFFLAIKLPKFAAARKEHPTHAAGIMFHYSNYQIRKARTRWGEYAVRGFELLHERRAEYFFPVLFVFENNLPDVPFSFALHGSDIPCSYVLHATTTSCVHCIRARNLKCKRMRHDGTATHEPRHASENIDIQSSHVLVCACAHLA